jgi:hypothetical protein
MVTGNKTKIRETATRGQLKESSRWKKAHKRESRPETVPERWETWPMEKSSG